MRLMPSRKRLQRAPLPPIFCHVRTEEICDLKNSPHQNMPGTITLDFQLPELWENDVCYSEVILSKIFCWSSPNTLRWALRLQSVVLSGGVLSLGYTLRFPLNLQLLPVLGLFGISVPVDQYVQKRLRFWER